MVARLMALALNPNLTAEQFTEASRRILDSQAELVRQARENARGLPVDARLKYLAAVMPFLWR